MLNTLSYFEGPDEYWEHHNEGHPVILFENNRNLLRNQMVYCYYSTKLDIIDYPSCQSMIATQTSTLARQAMLANDFSSQ